MGAIVDDPEELFGTHQEDGRFYAGEGKAAYLYALGTPLIVFDYDRNRRIDDVDIEILQRDFITYYEGADYYGLGLKIFTRMAHEAGAVYKIGKMVRIKREIFEEYLRNKEA